MTPTAELIALPEIGRQFADPPTVFVPFDVVRSADLKGTWRPVKSKTKETAVLNCPKCEAGHDHYFPLDQPFMFRCFCGFHTDHAVIQGVK